jgi:hypothetical protein
MAYLRFSIVLLVLLSAGAFSQEEFSKNLVHSNVNEGAAEYVVKKCQFHITNMFGGHFYIPSHQDSLSQMGLYDFPDTGPGVLPVLQTFGLSCQSSSIDEVGIALGAKQVDGKWLQYDPLPGTSGLTSFDGNAHPRTVTLKGANWAGIGLTVDATTGDEEKRLRFFSFCLIHNTQALCGNTPVARLADPKHNDLWRVKSILQSVVFCNPPGPASALP